MSQLTPRAPSVLAVCVHRSPHRLAAPADPIPVPTTQRRVEDADREDVPCLGYEALRREMPSAVPPRPNVPRTFDVYVPWLRSD